MYPPREDFGAHVSIMPCSLHPRPLRHPSVRKQPSGVSSWNVWIVFWIFFQVKSDCVLGASVFGYLLATKATHAHLPSIYSSASMYLYLLNRFLALPKWIIFANGKRTTTTTTSNTPYRRQNPHVEPSQDQCLEQEEKLANCGSSKAARYSWHMLYSVGSPHNELELTNESIE